MQLNRMQDDHIEKSSREIQFLLRCMSPDGVVRQNALLEKAESRTDEFWKKVVSLAAYHKLFPLLGKQVSFFSDAPVPVNIREELKKKLLINAVNSLASSLELLKFFDLCSGHGINACSFKGPVVALQAYGNIESRSFVDLDILVRGDEVSRLICVLKSEGYEMYPELNKRQIAAYLYHEDQVSLIHHKRKVIIDLHWEASARYSMVPFCFEHAADSLHDVDLLNGKCRTFSPENTIVLHCLHSGAHCWKILEHVACLAWIISANKKIDWDVVYRQANYFRCWRMVLLGLFLCEILFAVELPDSIMVEMETDLGVQKYGRLITDQLLECRHDPLATSLSRKFIGLHFFLRDSHVDALYYCFRLLFRPTIREWQSLSLPPRLAFLYYGYRPISLMIAGFHQIFNRKFH